MRSPRWLVAIVAGVLPALSACAAADDTPAPPPGYQHASSPSAVVLRVDTGGGFLPLEFALADHPDFSLMGDGSIITGAPQIAIYPPPALPALQVQVVDEDGIQAILAEADRAGVLDGDAHYDYPCVADAATTTITVTADGETSVTSVYALGIVPTEQALGEPAPEDGAETLPEGDQPGVDAADLCGLPEAEISARSQIATFVSSLADLDAWLPTGSSGSWEPYEPSAMRVFSAPYTAQPDIAQAPVTWPLAQPLGEFGSGVASREDLRCGVVDGADLTAVTTAAAPANTLTPWLSDDAEFALVLRALLPDETGCSTAADPGT